MVSNQNRFKVDLTFICVARNCSNLFFFPTTTAAGRNDLGKCLRKITNCLLLKIAHHPTKVTPPMQSVIMDLINDAIPSDVHSNSEVNKTSIKKGRPMMKKVAENAPLFLRVSQQHRLHLTRGVLFFYVALVRMRISLKHVSGMQIYTSRCHQSMAIIVCLDSS